MKEYKLYVVLGVRKVLELDESEKISLKFSDSFLQTWVRRNSVPNRSDFLNSCQSRLRNQNFFSYHGRWSSITGIWILGKVTNTGETDIWGNCLSFKLIAVCSFCGLLRNSLNERSKLGQSLFEKGMALVLKKFYFSYCCSSKLANWFYDPRPPVSLAPGHDQRASGQNEGTGSKKISGYMSLRIV